MAEQALRAIGEPHRREILLLLRGHELASGAIAAHFQVTRSAISQHLRVLKDAGLVSERRAGTRRFYRTRSEGLAELRDFLAELWEADL